MPQSRANPETNPAAPDAPQTESGSPAAIAPKSAAPPPPSARKEPAPKISKVPMPPSKFPPPLPAPSKAPPPPSARAVSAPPVPLPKSHLPAPLPPSKRSVNPPASAPPPSLGQLARPEGLAFPRPPEAAAERPVAELPSPERAGAERVQVKLPAREQFLPSPPAPASPALAQDRDQLALAFVKHCESSLAQNPTPSRAARLHYEIARLLESPLGQQEAALEHYEKSFALNPQHVPTLRGARRLHRAAKRYTRALAYYDAELRLTADPRVKAALLYEKGVLLEDHVAKKNDARDAFRSALELDPTNATILKAAERVESQAKAWDKLDQVLELQANTLTGSAALHAARVAARAHLAEGPRADPQAAVEFYKTALKLDPEAPGALAALKSLLYSQKRWRELTEVLNEEAQLCAEPQLRAAAFYRIAVIRHDLLGELEPAIVALEAARKETPSDPTLYGTLARYYEAAQRFSDLVVTKQRLADITSDEQSRVALLHEVAQLCEEKLADDAAAIERYRAVLAVQPGYTPSLQAVLKLYTKHSLWQELIQTRLAEVQTITDVEQRAVTLAAIAEVYEHEVRRGDKAVEYHLRALEQRPGYEPSFKAIVRLYSEVGRWHELIEMYLREAERDPDVSARVNSLLKAGALYEDTLSDYAASLHTYKRVLALEPQHLPALHAAERAAERGGLWRELTELLVLEYEKAKAPSLSLLLRAGEVLEQRLGVPEEAIACYKRILEKDASHRGATAALGNLYHRLGRFEDLVGVYRLELTALKEVSARAALLYRIGEICENRLGDVREATGYYRQALELDATHSEALASLLRILSADGKWNEVAKLLELALPGMSGVETLAANAFRLGEMYEHRLNNPEKALQSYQRALKASPLYRPALDAQARLLERTEDYPRLVNELERESELSPDRAVAVAASYREAQFLREELKKPEASVACLSKLLEQEPRHVGALLLLEQLYFELGMKAELCELYERQAAVFDAPHVRASALNEQFRLAEGLGKKDQHQLLDGYVRVNQLMPGDPYALLSLERLAFINRDMGTMNLVDAVMVNLEGPVDLVSAHRTRFAESLEAQGSVEALKLYRAALTLDPENLAAARGISRIAERSNDSALIVEAAHNEASLLGDRRFAASLLIHSSMLRETKRDIEAAIVDLERALEADPDNEQAAARLSNLLLQSPPRLITALSKAATRAEKATRRMALWLDIAGIHSGLTGDRGAAINAAERAANEDGRDARPLVRLADLCIASEQWEPAADHLKRVLTLESTPEIRRVAHLKLAQVALWHLKNSTLALNQVRAVLSEDENHRDALEILYEIEIERRDLAHALSVAERLLQTAPSVSTKAAALNRMAEVELQRGDFKTYVALMKQAVSLVGFEGGAATRLREALEVQKLKKKPADFASYAEGLLSFADNAAASVAARARVFLELGRVLADELGQVDRSLMCLKRGIALAPNDVELARQYAARLHKAGYAEDAVREYLRVLDVAPEELQLWRELRQVFRDTGRQEQARLALAPIIALKQASEMDIASYSMRAPGMQANAGAFDPASLRHADASSTGDDILTTLSVCLTPVLSKIFSPSFATYGVSLRDRVGARSGHPLRTLADRVAAILGVSEFEVYVHELSRSRVALEFTDSPSLLIPGSISKESEAGQIFLMAQALAAIARGVTPAERLSPSELEFLFAAAARAMNPHYTGGRHDDRALNELNRKIVKAMPRRNRRAFEEAALAYSGISNPDLRGWALRARQGSTRAALIVADDLASSLSLLYAQKADSSGEAHEDMSRIVSDALAFAVSDAAVVLRRRVLGGML